MARVRTLLYGEADPLPRDGHRIDAAQREASLRRELAQLQAGGWQRGAPVLKRPRASAPPAARPDEPLRLRVVVPPAASRAPRLVPPPPPRPRPRRRRNREGALIAGVTLGGVLCVGLALLFAFRGRTAARPRNGAPPSSKTGQRP